MHTCVYKGSCGCNCVVSMCVCVCVCVCYAYIFIIKSACDVYVKGGDVRDRCV